MILIFVGYGSSCTDADPQPLNQTTKNKKSPEPQDDEVSDDLEGDEGDDPPKDHGETFTALETSTKTNTSTAPNPNTATNTQTATSPNQFSDVVEFRIKAGTGSGPWNTRETMVTVKVGQTLRIVNDDSTVHRLHTGGAPCPHQPGSGLKNGEEYLCKIERTLDVGNGRPATYDHISGQNASFFLKAVN